MLTSHLAVAPGRGPWSRLGPRPGFEEARKVGLQWPVPSSWGKLRPRRHCRGQQWFTGGDSLGLVSAHGTLEWQFSVWLGSHVGRFPASGCSRLSGIVLGCMVAQRFCCVVEHCPWTDLSSCSFTFFHLYKWRLDRLS